MVKPGVLGTGNDLGEDMEGSQEQLGRWQEQECL